MVSVPLARDPEATRRSIGVLLYTLGMLCGAFLLVAVLFSPALGAMMGMPTKNGDVEAYAMATGAVFALPMLFIYLWVPWIVDRYDPEPWWALLMTLAWGAIAACGFSGLINTVVHEVGNQVVGRAFGDALGACVSAPIVEEGTKGLAVFFMFYFMRREFDGVVDGVIYATFAALGFAAVENIVYYGNAAKTEVLQHKEGILAGTFIVRGILAPWGHPLYTSMTGIGFGIARETRKGWLKWCAPIGGYFFAAFLHSTWNTAATISNELVAVMLPLWFLFVLAFFVLVVWLVRRKGKIIQDHLRDEVLMGNLTPWELQLIASPVGRIRASLSYGGSAGRRFVDAAARLALSKWHTGRATQGRKLTVSADMIFPLRQQLRKLRDEIARSLGRPIEQPRPWAPGGSPGAPPIAAWAPPIAAWAPPQGAWQAPRERPQAWGPPQGAPPQGAPPQAWGQAQTGAPPTGAPPFPTQGAGFAPQGPPQPPQGGGGFTPGAPPAGGFGGPGQGGRGGQGGGFPR